MLGIRDKICAGCDLMGDGTADNPRRCRAWTYLGELEKFASHLGDRNSSPAAMGLEYLVDMAECKKKSGTFGYS